MSEAIPDHPAPALQDPWEPSPPILLDGWLERNAFAPLFLAFFGLIAAFILFQIIISPVATIVLLLMQGVHPERLLEGFETIIEEHARSLLTANTIGQVLGLALPAYLLARLHTGRPRSYLRIRRSDVSFVGLGFVGVLSITPAIQWLGQVNEHIPLPDFIRKFEESQMALIEKVLLADTGLGFNLLVLAITPALCEELLFRGYIQRQAERGGGIIFGILFSGIVFGLYHLRLSQAIPLCVLGVYLAWLVWRTGSLWPAIVVHFSNNAIAIVTGAYIARRPDMDMADLEAIEIPWYMVAFGLVIFGAIVFGIERTARRLLQKRKRYD
ncbi:MAG: type II CAAX endopeptidase family protein [Rhodothermales bacterium]